LYEVTEDDPFQSAIASGAGSWDVTPPESKLFICFDEATPMFRFGDKQDFSDAMERDWEELLAQGLVHYEDLINEYPDRFMWGTDRADIVWIYDADIGQLLVKFGRDFIGRPDPAVQEKVGHLNAESLLQ